MPEALLPPFRPLAISFSEFLAVLIQALDREGLPTCILRNYEGFPSSNIGNDVDFLILPADLPRAIRVIQSIQSIQIVNYSERTYVACVFIEGTSSTSESRLLQVDFISSLSWEELPYLAVDDVLQAAISRRTGNLSFFVPSPVHEAISSLLASLLVGGWVKEKYFPKVQRTFASERSGAIAALLPRFGVKTATRLVDSVIDDDRRKILGCIRSLRISLALRSLLRRPVLSVAAIARYNAREFAIRFSRKNLQTVCVLGADGCGKTKIIESLMPILRFSAKEVREHHFSPTLPFSPEQREVRVNATSQDEAPRGIFTSMAKAVQWFVEEWLRQFLGRKNLTLRICERNFNDVPINPKRYRYGGPEWFVQILGRMAPSPDLWILLDASVEIMQSRSQEVPPGVTARQLEAYRTFVKTRKNYVILDASQPAAGVTEAAYTAIIHALTQHISRKVKNRF